MSTVRTNLSFFRWVKVCDLEKLPSQEIVVRSDKPTEKPIPTEAYQTLQRSLKFLSMIGMFIGINYEFEWKLNVRFMMTKFITAFFWSQIFYTQFLYVYTHNIARIWEVFAIYGIGGSAVLKILCFQKYFKNITALFNGTLKICRENNGIRGEKLKKRLDANFTFFKGIASLGIVITLIYMFYPVKSFIIDGELVPFVPLEVIFLDQSTMQGYLLTSAIMVMGGLYAVFGTEFMGLTFVYLVANYTLRVDVLETDFMELDEMWSHGSTSTSTYKQTVLINVCRKYIDMRNYIAEIKRIFDQKLFLFFAFAYLSQILCLYQIRVNNWIPGYALALGFFLEMIFYCVMGTEISVENKRFCFIITQSKWYLYDEKSKKLILNLLSLAMNNEELWIGPLNPLSVYTATEIVKSIYSYYTVLMEVV